MANQTHGEIGTYGPNDKQQRVYIPKDLRVDSSYPFSGGEDVLIKAVGPGLVVMPTYRSTLASKIEEFVEEIETSTGGVADEP